eukprot:310701_1
MWPRPQCQLVEVLITGVGNMWISLSIAVTYTIYKWLKIEKETMYKILAILFHISTITAILFQSLYATNRCYKYLDTILDNIQRWFLISYLLQFYVFLILLWKRVLIVWINSGVLAGQCITRFYQLFAILSPLLVTIIGVIKQLYTIDTTILWPHTISIHFILQCFSCNTENQIR